MTTPTRRTLPDEVQAAIMVLLLIAAALTA